MEQPDTASKRLPTGFVRGVAVVFGGAWHDIRHGQTLTRLLATSAVLGAMSMYVLTFIAGGRSAIPWLPELPWNPASAWRPVGEQLTRLLHGGAFNFPGVPFFLFPGQRGKISVALAILLAALWAARACLSRDGRVKARPLGIVLVALSLSVCAYAAAAWGAAVFLPGHTLRGYVWLSLLPGMVWDVADAAAGAVAVAMLMAGAASTALGALPRMLEETARHFRRLFVFYLALLLAMRAVEAAPMALLHMEWANLRCAAMLQEFAPIVSAATMTLLAFVPAIVIADGVAVRRAVATSIRLWHKRAGAAGAAILLLWMAGRVVLSVVDRFLPPSVIGSAAVLFLTLELQAWALLATIGTYRSFGRERYCVAAPAREAAALNTRV